MILYRFFLILLLGGIAGSLAAAQLAVKMNQATLDQKLYKAVVAGNLYDVKKHIKNGASPDTPLEAHTGKTALMAALELSCWQDKQNEYTRCSCIQILETLLAKSVQIDAKNNEGETALSLAIGNERLLRIKMLVTAGANINQPWSNKTILGKAAFQYNPKITRYLLNAGADCTVSDYAYVLIKQPSGYHDENKENQKFETIITLLNGGQPVEFKHKELSENKNVREAFVNYKQRHAAYKQIVVHTILTSIDEMIGDLAQIIVQYAVVSAPKRTLTATEMNGIQPIIEAIACCKDEEELEENSIAINRINEEFEKLKPVLNSMQIAKIEDALNEQQAWAAKQGNNCTVM